MIVCNSKSSFRKWRASQIGPVGFVPTMGFLHEGHAELLKRSIAANSVTVLSIFVNPTQFGPNEDLDRYPRDFERDQKLAEELGVDCIFYPTTDDMYDAQTTISLSAGEMANRLCGASRPGHFDGVLQVVTKLFNIVQPSTAYFGQKDAQQLALIDSLVSAFDFPLTIERVATIRESDGLAKSSRNVYLTTDERSQASELYKALQLGKTAFEEGASREQTIALVKQHISSKTTGLIDYVDLLTYPNLEPLDTGSQFVLACAVYFSKARLIDNLLIERVKNNATYDVE